MRTTFTLEPDVAAEVERLRRSDGLGISEAVNRLIRQGMAAPVRRNDYVHKSADVGVKIDVSNIGDVLDTLDEM